MKNAVSVIFLWGVLWGVFLWQETCFAGSVELPEEELAKETVVPRFDHMESVRSRNVVTEKKFEFAPYFGWNNTEPIYNQAKLGLNLGYHSTEFTAWVLNIASWLPGRNTQYTDALKEKYKLDFDRAPNIVASVYLNYEMKAYYGKISLTKNGVMNMSMYSMLGGGVTNYVHKTYPGVDGGVGIKFYFTPRIALRTDLKIQFSQGVNPFLAGSGLKTTTSTKPSYDQFTDKWALATILDLGVSFLF